MAFLAPCTPYFLLVGMIFFGACSPIRFASKKKTGMDKNSNYVLVWSDEFEDDGSPNPANWSFEHGFVRNEEWQWYQEDNAFVENGVLVIEGRRETFPNPNYDSSSSNWRLNRPMVHYTSSCLKTADKHSWTYGRFEIRAKIKAEEGLWPAIWTLGTGHEWPSGGEIDIMEYYDGNILANAAWAGARRWQAIWDASQTPVSSFGDSNWDQEFHTWTMDWTEEKIILYLDNQLLNSISLNKTINQTGTLRNPFRENRHYLLLNLAIGGTKGGDPSHTKFPSRYEIDYVRVYQQK